MIPLPRGLEDPGGLWTGRLGLAVYGGLVAFPLLAVDLLVASGVAASWAPASLAGLLHGVPGAVALIAAHFGVLALLVRLGSRGLSSRILAGAVDRLRLHHLAELYQRHRRILAAYFAEDERPRFVVEVDPPGGGVPARTATLVLAMVAGAALLEVAVLFAQRAQDVAPPGYARGACLGLVTAALLGLLFGDLDRLRARVLVGLGAGGILVVWGLRPGLLSWGPGLVPAMVILLVATVVRVTRVAAATRLLFLTDKGLRLVRLTGDSIEDVHGATLRPERLILSPGNGESQWELFASGEAPLEVQPIGGRAQEIGVFGALHGFPVRVSGEGGAGPLFGELARSARAVVPLALLGAWLVVGHWVPAIAALF